MKKITAFLSLFLLLHLHSYSQANDQMNKEKLKKEIMMVEKSFGDELLAAGVAAAFYKYAADNAVIKRENDSLIVGREAIKNYYSNPMYKNAVAVWSPDYIDVSGDGTMAYTYGKYTWTFKDSSGKNTTYKGVFHTVWKKMGDGVWKYVWD